jgi:hypothetical protein
MTGRKVASVVSVMSVVFSSPPAHACNSGLFNYLSNANQGQPVPTRYRERGVSIIQGWKTTDITDVTDGRARHVLDREGQEAEARNSSLINQKNPFTYFSGDGFGPPGFPATQANRTAAGTPPCTLLTFLVMPPRRPPGACHSDWRGSGEVARCGSRNDGDDEDNDNT